MTMPSTWLKLASQTAVITGAASGIGRATAIAFAEQGCNLLLADTATQQSKLQDVVSACYDAAGRCFPDENDRSNPKNSNKNISIIALECNVTDKVQVQKTIQAADEVAQNAITSSHSIASILVNCAGITRDSRLPNITNEDWDEVMDVNLKGTFLMCQEFCNPARLGKLLGGGDNGETREVNRGGSIINIGSVVSTYGNVGQVNYAASKGGVVGLTRSIAKEMALFSNRLGNTLDCERANNVSNRLILYPPPVIRVNCIQPGFIATPMAHAVPEKILAEVTNKIALRRLGQAQDVANLVLFLASCARSGYITGEAFECSGMLRL